jgi:hypothetical protein
MIVIGCVVLVGCGTKPVVPTEPASFADQIAATIQEAESGGAGDAQLAILRKAESEGELSLEDVRTATRAAVECVNDAGSLAGYAEVTKGWGLVVPWNRYTADTPEMMAIGEECDVREDYWVGKIYQTQPTSQALNEAFLEQQVPLVRSCLEQNGYTVVPDATTREVLRQAFDVMNDTVPEVNCITTFGIEGW